LGVEKNEFSVRTHLDFEDAGVNVSVTGGAEAEDILPNSLPALGVFFDVVDMEPDLSRAVGNAAAPTVPSECLFSLGFGEGAGVRIEAESAVGPRLFGKF
jgi:hypothetical protein